MTRIQIERHYVCKYPDAEKCSYCKEDSICGCILRRNGQCTCEAAISEAIETYKRLGGWL